VGVGVASVTGGPKFSTDTPDSAPVMNALHIFAGKVPP
jgi:hypothetical protein